MNKVVSIKDYEGTDIEKGFVSSIEKATQRERAGLVKETVVVDPKGRKKHKRTQWTIPAEERAMRRRHSDLQSKARMLRIKATELRNEGKAEEARKLTEQARRLDEEAKELEARWERARRERAANAEKGGETMKSFSNVSLKDYEGTDIAKGFNTLYLPLRKAIEQRKDVSPAEEKRAIEEYGKVKFADPVNKKFPIDNYEHVRAAISYFGMPRNYKYYSMEDRRIIAGRIAAAAKKFGIEVDPEWKKKHGLKVEEEEKDKRRKKD